MTLAFAGTRAGGVRKKTRKTPQAAIRMALSRMQELEQ